MVRTTECNLDELLDDVLNDDTAIVTDPTDRTVTTDEFVMENTKHEAILPSCLEERNFYSKENSLRNFMPSLKSKTYNFPLDFFQRLAISAIELNHSVLVAAHTSCGKTVVAEYAIAQSLKNKQRVIYTSPIKALSNQKFRELKEEFKDVGLMTGDVTLNPEATCLVMTTEILRNMLYRNSEVVREIHWIIFDEIHYLKDAERGVVWEETIILLPKHVRMVFLSATIPNAREFSEWISYVQKQIVHVIYTEKRVIPLKHFFYYNSSGRDNRHSTYKLALVKDHSVFYTDNFIKSQENLINRKEVSNALISLLNEISVPAVIFSFSRASCEYFASKVTKDYLNEEEKEVVRVIFNNALQGLSEEDRELEGISSMLSLFERGIGIHHSGLVPVVREISEILFQESLIKILFATETFAIGLNMPAKTVLFTSLRKFDGVSERLLSSSEYCQMSGRAGRRGLDVEGIVISLVTAQHESKEVVKMVDGQPDPLNSAFYLKYNMILNLMRTEDLDATYFLSRSFFHYQTYSRSVEEQKELKQVDLKVEDFSVKDKNEKVLELLKVREELLLKRSLALIKENSGYLSTKHRVVDLVIPREGFPTFIKKGIIVGNDEYQVKVAFYTEEAEGKICVKTFPQHFIFNIYKNSAKVTERSFFREYSLLKFNCSIDGEISEIENKLISVIAHKKFTNFIENRVCILCGRDCCMEDLYRELSSTAVLNKAYGSLKNSAVLETLKKMRVKSLERICSLRKIYHMDQCKKMVELLRHMKYLDGNKVLLKGKMASEISTSDEILLTEMVFSSSFNSLSLPDTIALLSILITERSKEGENIVISEENAELIQIVQKNIEKVTKAMNECGIEITAEDYGRDFHYYMMDIVRLWINGSSFRDICSKTKVFEGSIIRSFKRLEELLRQLSSAATVIGNNELANLFGQGIYLIKRDIIFANSLYL